MREAHLLVHVARLIPCGFRHAPWVEFTLRLIDHKNRQGEASYLAARFLVAQQLHSSCLVQKRIGSNECG